MQSQIPIDINARLGTGSARNMLAILGLLGVLVYALFIGLLPGSLGQNDSTDYTHFYEPVAENLVAGKGLVTPDGSLALRYPPGYPMLLAGLLEVSKITRVREPILLIVLTGVATCATPVLIFGITATAFDLATAFLAGVLAATYPFYLWLTKQPNSEIPFLPVFLFAVYLFVRCVQSGRCSGQGLYIGALIGAASLIRPFAFALGAVLLVVIWALVRNWTTRQRFVFSALLVLGNVFVVLPWEGWVREQSGRWIVLSTNGPISIVDGLTFPLKEDAGHRPLHVSSEIRGVMEDIANRSQELQSVSAIGRLLIKKFGESPLALSNLMILKAGRAWYANDTRSHEKWVALLQAPYLFFATIGASIAVKSGSRRREVSLILILLTLYSWVMTTIALSILRYMVPAMLVLMPLVSLGVICAAKPLLAIHHRWQKRLRVSVRQDVPPFGVESHS